VGTTIELSTLADGAVSERFNIELARVLDNMMDPNTDASKARKLTLTLTFKGDDNRDVVTVSVDTKTALVPPIGVATKILMDRDREGKAVGAELYQTPLFKPEDFAPTRDNVSHLESKRVGRE